jgi:hypothetical protein
MTREDIAIKAKTKDDIGRIKRIMRKTGGREERRYGRGEG